ncbi:hypothetical protein [Cryobacterium roopkundense]|uniref:Uncharacterized protein n=1 Tax=Cryobacterium roopkundense TaxID=1001240 RepID=A0A7W8ZWY0_9MICO|nr:hypothetical protein [Cryobacterium roopkundense]MBB5641435.1 hypothetical protein [Cryobacterium roopkundense]
MNEPVTVWTSEAGSPVRVMWRSRRFRVSDTPTALVGTSDWWKPFEPYSYGIGHPPLDIAGWRFQATADDGETHVFDVSQDDSMGTESSMGTDGMGTDGGENRGGNADGGRDPESRSAGRLWRLVRIFD